MKLAAARLGARIRSFRKKAALTQEQLSFKSGLHVTYISGLESGSRNPSLLVLIALSRALNVTLSELVNDIEGTK